MSRSPAPAHRRGDEDDGSSAGAQSDAASDEGFSEEEEEEDGHSAPMMSIFASYYGIEDPNQGEAEAKGTIDDSNFNSEEYVKTVLQNESVEGLVAKDADLIHEIRNLDGEMQKLVYDNYNKFITATETIKEMKADVFGMDEDMQSVRDKMQVIASNSVQLDGVFEVKRQQVDKLVRVRRLLDRLDFLSELPEKLAGMIERKQYKEAVQLYNKSISVLTRHSHVLSFKNIKERTEAMMADLTSKVIDLLEDSSLEAVKLTQYVVVLRMMKAPRDKVMRKLLSAHRNRSLRMILQFKQATAAPMLLFEDAPAALSVMRQFHQSMLVSLIEACKGMRELYEDDRSAYPELSQMVGTVMGDYQAALVTAFRRFFDCYLLQVQRLPVDLSVDMDEVRAIDSMSQSQQQAPPTADAEEAVNRFALQEERSSWLLLARQAINDVIYLDQAQRDCAPLAGGRKHADEEHAKGFADALLAEMYAHNDSVQGIVLRGYAAGVLAWLPRVTAIAQHMDSSHSQGDSQQHRDNKHSAAAGGYRTTLPKGMALARKMLDNLEAQALECFASAARNLKPVLDILEAIGSADCERVQDQLCARFCESLCATLQQAAHMVWNTAYVNNAAADEEGGEIFALPQYTSEEVQTGATEGVRCVTELLCAGVLRRLGPGLLTLMAEELGRQDYPSVQIGQSTALGATRRLQAAEQAFLERYVTTNRHALAQAMHTYCLRLFAANYDKMDESEDKDVSVAVGADMLVMAGHLDSYGLHAALLLQEQPPVRAADTVRRAGHRQSIAANANAQSLTLQLDMDRLFSQKVAVCERIVAGASMDVLVNAMVKAVLKAMLEAVRCMTLPLQGYLTVQADAAFIKQVSACLMNSLGDCDALVDQVMTAVFSRYAGANDVSNAADNAEVNMVNRAVAEAMQLMAADGKTVLIVKVR